MPGKAATADTSELSPGAAANGRHNYLLGVANGTLVRLGMAFFNPSLVVAAFIYERTRSMFLVGLASSLWIAGMMWPQLYLSSLMEHRPRKKPFYIASTVSRIILLSVMTVVVFLSGRVAAGWIIAVFFVVYFLYTSAQGCSILPFWEIVGQSIPTTRRGGFLGYRGLIGGALAFAAGLLVAQPIVSGVASPTNYALLMLIALGCLGVGWSLFAFAREEALPDPPKPRSFRQVLTSGARRLRSDLTYAQLLLIRICFRFNRLALAFYVPYGIDRLGAAGLSGLFVAFLSISRLTSSLVWGRMSDRRGNRRCLLWAGALFTANPAVALVAPLLPPVFNVPLPFTEVVLDLPLSLYLLALCLFGFAQQANIIGYNALALESAPADRRASHIGFLNTMVFPFTFLPALAGALIGTHTERLNIVFAVIIATGLCYTAIVWCMTDVRHANASKVDAIL